MATDRILIFDTTLRDGEQGPGFSLHVEEKLALARALDALGVDIMEAGFPIASPKDAEAVRRIASEIRRPTIAALARCRRLDLEKTFWALEPAAHPRVHIVLATSDLHLEKKLNMTRSQCIDAAAESVRFARAHVDDVEFSAEDALRSDVDFLCRVIEAVIQAGATTINLPDTVAMRSIALTCHLTVIWSHDLRRASTCLNDRDVDDVFGDEPYLTFVASDDPTDNQIVRAIISSFSRPACHRASLLQHDLVRVQQARDLDWHFLPPLRRPRNKRRLCDIVRHRNAHAAEQLNALGHSVDHLVLLVIVLIEEEMELIERGAGNLPVMFLVQVAKRHRVGQQLIEIVDALFARVFRQCNRHSDQVAERLDLVRGLPGDGRGTLQNL